MESVKIMFQSTDEIEEFVKLVEHYPADIDLQYGSYMVDGKSLLGSISLGTYKTLDLKIHDDSCNDLLNQLSFCVQSR